MIWEAKRYSRNLLFWGSDSLNLLITLPLLSSVGLELGSIFLSGIFLYLLIINFSYWKNPVLLRVVEDGVYVRGKYFIPYADIISTPMFFSQNKISLWIDNVTIKKYSYFTLRNGFSATAAKIRRNNTRLIGFMWLGSTSVGSNEVYQTMASYHKKATGRDLSAGPPQFK